MVFSGFTTFKIWTDTGLLRTRETLDYFKKNIEFNDQLNLASASQELFRSIDLDIKIPKQAHILLNN